MHGTNKLAEGYRCGIPEPSHAQSGNTLPFDIYVRVRAKLREEKLTGFNTVVRTGRPLANQYDQLRCMLDKLKNEHANQIKNVVENGVKFGCAYTRTPEAPKIMDNVSQALTCVYAKYGTCD
ncbi:unnamed protein product [Nippostrongylus brasiliensis]|uniref:SCP domain-containing protein n=1 Tax=Nippostrongylus brasiliensis TaxID=27835 RepID=A0A0N4Y752_NIPBR|nr:unnamed protein product [Nippostrongylus brasiliensis]